MNSSYLGDSGNGIDVGVPRRLHADEGEEESEDKGKYSLADVHMELGAHERTAHDDTDQKTARPRPLISKI